MADGYLTFADGELRLGGDLLPGILTGRTVRGMVRFDEAETDGLSGTTKTPLGWEDADIMVMLDLLSDDQSDCYTKLTSINAVFKGTDNGSNPKVFTVTDRHLRARGVDQVVFKGLDSTEDDQEDTISVVLSFVEHVPVVVRQEKQVAVSSEPLTVTPSVTTATTEPEVVLEDDSNAFMAGLEVGLS